MAISARKIKEEFNRIKSIGFIKSNRSATNSGSVGNTFEDYLGVAENNRKDPDFDGFEVKTRRSVTNSPITLFTKSPSYPKRANSFLRKTFGIPNKHYPNIRTLNVSIRGTKKSLVYKKYFFSFKIDRRNERMTIVVKKRKGNVVISDEVYYTFETLRAIIKLENTFIVSAEREHRSDGEYFHYTKAEVYYGFNIASFLNCLEEGKIQYDIRLGVYLTGKNKGKAHDHGSAMRINKKDSYSLFANKVVVE